MGRLSNVKPVEVKVRLEDYIHLILGEKKTGKSTLFRDLVHKHYDGDMSKGFLAGFENGFKALDGLHAEKIEDWDDWEDYVEEFVEDREKISYRFIAIDTIDYFFKMARDKTLKDSKKKDGKIVKTLNEAFGGFNRGKDYCIDLMRNSLDRLHNGGYGLFLIGHTKLKKKNTGSVLGEEQEYIQLSCNLTNDYANVFEDMADMITYLVVEKEVNDSIQDAKKRTAKSKVNMHFRSDGAIDCGGRFADLPTKLSYSVENYLKAFGQGVKSSILKTVSNEEIEEMAKKQQKESEEKAKEYTKKASIEDMVSKIKEGFGDLGDGAKLKMQEYVQEAEIESLDELNESHREIVENMYELIS